MARRLTGAFLATVALIISTTAAPAKIAPPPPIFVRVAEADCVVVGKVTSIDDKTIKIGEVEYRVAVIKLDEGILKAKGLTHVRVAYRPDTGRFKLDLPVGHEGLYFLSAVKGESFYTTTAYSGVIAKGSGSGSEFDLAVNEAKRAGKVLDDPVAALKSKEANERGFAAGMLIIQARSNRFGSAKTEPIDAEISKLILKSLADVEDWKGSTPFNQFGGPLQLFLRLGVTEKDGWNQPKDFAEIPAVAAKWLKENAETYRIQRFVPDAK